MNCNIPLRPDCLNPSAPHCTRANAENQKGNCKGISEIIFHFSKVEAAWSRSNMLQS